MMKDMNFTEMQQMQYELWEKHKEKWSPLQPEFARHSLLWMIEEIGEVIAIIKKKGETEIMENPAVRSAFVEELADVLMYYNDMLLCCQITPEEIATAYCAKHRRNLGRDYETAYKKMFEEE